MSRGSHSIAQMLLQESNAKKIVTNSMISRHETLETNMVASLKREEEKEYNLDDGRKPIISCEEKFTNSDGISHCTNLATNSCNL